MFPDPPRISTTDWFRQSALGADHKRSLNASSPVPPTSSSLGNSSNERA